MNRIKFTHNWNNKLDSPVFTTIRRATDSKIEYYSRCIGEDFTVILNNSPRDVVELVSVTVKRLQDIDEELIALDTGLVDYYKAIDLFERFGCKLDKAVIVLLFKSKGEKWRMKSIK